MPEMYFSIPLNNHPALVELQDYLRDKLPASTRFEDAAHFHITLVYIPDVGQTTVDDITVPAIPMFGIGGFELAEFDTPDGYAVHVAVERNPQLVTLQASIFYELKARGLLPSANHYPGMYRPHITLAYVPKEDYQHTYIPLPSMLHFQVEKFELDAEGYVVQREYPLITEYPGNRPVAEMAIIRETMQWQFTGSVPDVPIAAGVNVKEIAADDGEPFFVTLPAFSINKPSANRRIIDEAEAKEIIRQINDEKPTGIMGHLEDDERDSKFPVPEIYWVGAKQVKDLAWVKGYVPPGDVREMLRNMKKTSSKIALSIYGPADQTWDKERGAWALSKMNLEQIDLAPPKRSGFGLAIVPHITKEMAGSVEIEVREMEITPEVRKQVIAEMMAGDLPEPVKLELLQQSNEAKLVKEMRGALGISDDGDLVKVVAEMAQTVATMKKAELEQAIVAEIAKQVMPDAVATNNTDDPVTAVRSVVRQMVVVPADASGIEASVKAAVQLPAVQTMLKNIVVKQMGPNMGRRSLGQNGNQLDDSPEAVAAARSRWGF